MFVWARGKSESVDSSIITCSWKLWQACKVLPYEPHSRRDRGDKFYYTLQTAQPTIYYAWMLQRGLFLVPQTRQYGV